MPPTSNVTCLQAITGDLRSVYYRRDRSFYGIREKPKRAIAITAFGGPEVLQFTEVPQPPPAPGQVVIRVAYTGMNFAEIMGWRWDYHALGAGDGTPTRDSLLGRQGVTKPAPACYELA